MCKKSTYAERVERNTEGLTAVSVGVCPGCPTCLDEYGLTLPCSCCNGTGYNRVRLYGNVDCPVCDGDGKRKETMEEFEERWSSGGVIDEPSFTWHGCDVCGSTLGLDAQVWHALDANNEIIHGEHACHDCACYLANGDEPEDSDED
jgi:hypothetical protein